jgi:hypothetical protein
LSAQGASPTSIAASDSRFALATTLIFVIVCGFAIAHHEMWRDELQAWLIARESTSVAELLGRVRYEGHPTIWYLLLYAVTRVTHRPEAMQWMHLAIAGSAAYLLARFAPFPRWARAALCFGYFPLYEYGVIARNYSLGLLFLFAAAALFAHRRERPWLLGAVLALAAHTSVHALLLAAAFAGTVLAEPFVIRPAHNSRAAALKTLSLALISSLVAAVALRPPPDSGFFEQWVTNVDRVRAEHVFDSFARALVPLPSDRAVWGDLWLDSLNRHVASVVALALIAALVVHLWRRRVGLVAFFTGSAALTSFFYVKYPGSIRHHGFLFVNVLLALWVSERIEAEPAAAKGDVERAPPIGGAWFWRAAALVVAAHVIAGVTAVWRETTLVFSAGEATAALLAERGLAELPLVGDADWAMPSVIGFLDGHPMYYPRGKRFGTFVVLDQARHGKVTDEDVLVAARSLSEERRSAVGIVLNRPASPAVVAATEEIGCRSAVLTLRESYCVFRLEPH